MFQLLELDLDTELIILKANSVIDLWASNQCKKVKSFFIYIYIYICCSLHARDADDLQISGLQMRVAGS